MKKAWRRNYDAGVVICQLKTSGYDAGVVNTTLGYFHNSEHNDASIVTYDVVFL